MDRTESLRREMLDSIYHGGAWFSTRKDNYLKIAYSDADSCLFARECVIKNGRTEGDAYTFGTDWFDISFHGRYIDIYVDPDTFRRHKPAMAAADGSISGNPRRSPASYDHGTAGPSASSGAGSDLSRRLAEFCRQADAEALSGDIKAYHIDKADFAKAIEYSENYAELSFS